MSEICTALSVTGPIDPSTMISLIVVEWHVRIIDEVSKRFEQLIDSQSPTMGLSSSMLESLCLHTVLLGGAQS
jgi:hypothetical protein